ncbi:hypothetical protein JTE88_08555 [Arcanobacterium phocisimile]|uniref:Restriction endonuclease type II-like domain-containing protein n=1 Tax=Arcanobacterium phocisimile TaxID=1302235 RepID=A0ABX7IHV2_9ACTO|nr:hypothetical protein [Arcanobacterium phocisimile]QRV02109.1 hypothetical protein JTE88_08555 [Arcanobacterium phocisimile]
MEKQLFRRSQLPTPLDTNRYQLHMALSRKELGRLHHHWYATPNASNLEITAATHGFLIGCCTAANLWGLWMPDSKTPHFICPRNAQRVEKRGMIIHRALNGHRQFGIHHPPSKAPHIICSLVEAVEQVVHYHDAETGLIILESALNKQKITLAAVDEIISYAQKRKQPILRRRISTAQSGSETRVRSFLQSLGVQVQPQVWLAGVGRVDLLVGKSLIIECDSTAFHSHPLNVVDDRRRDAQQTRLGYSFLRLSYHQVWDDWENTCSYIRAVLHTRKHLKPPRPLVGRFDVQ